MSILNTVMSLVFIFLLYSLFATALQESLATMIQRRSKTLYDGIKSMLTNTPNRQLSMLTWIAYWLGIWWLIKKIHKEWAYRSDDSDLRRLRTRDANIEDSDNASVSLYERFYDHPIIKNYGQNNLFSKPSYITDKNFSAVLIDVIKNLIGTNKTRTANFQMIQDAVDKNKGNGCIEKEVVEILQYHLNESGGDLDVFKSRLEQWYNDTMDRVSGWYKRNTQFWLFAIGIFLAVSFNVDTIEIGKFLSKNPAISDEVASIAVAMIEKDTSKGTNPALDSIKKQLTATNTLLGLGWSDYGKSDSMFVKLLREKKPEWKMSNKKAIDEAYQEHAKYIGLRYIAYKSTLSKLLGFFITSIAIGLGAPFWFDLLNKLSSLRAAGKVINAGTEGKKDNQTIDG